MDTVSTTTVLVKIGLSKIGYGKMEGSVHTVQCMIWPTDGEAALDATAVCTHIHT